MDTLTKYSGLDTLDTFKIVYTDSNMTVDYIRKNKKLDMTISVPDFENPGLFYTLTFFINPNQIQYSFNKIIGSNFTRSGYIVETLGENLDSFTTSGTIGAFYIRNPNTGNVVLTNSAKIKSQTFRQLILLLSMFKNNACKIKESGIKYPQSNLKLISNSSKLKKNNKLGVNYLLNNNKKRIYSVSDIKISYNSKQFLGCFENFNYTESADKPYTVDYNFTYTIRKTNEE